MSQQTVSIVLPDLRGGGAERVNTDLAKGFRDRGINVDFVLRRAQGELLEEAQSIGRVIDLGAPRVRSSLRPLTQYLREQRPDAVLASMWPLTFVTIWARRLSGHDCPVVLAEHGVLSRQYKDHGFWHTAIMRRSLRHAAGNAQGVVGVSRGVASDLSELTGHKQDRFSVIYNPVTPAKEPSDEQLVSVDELWRGGRGKRIITVGRFKPVKNQALLIDALALLNDPDARLMLLGDGEMQHDLEDHAKSKSVADQVIFPGFQKDLSAFYATADLFALSSWSEGFGNVIVEAMGYGLPVVSTDCPTGPREILEDGRFGSLTPPGDAETLASEMAAALAGQVDADKQKARAAEFAPEQAVEEYLRLLGV